MTVIYRKKTCISRTFLLKYWAQNWVRGLYTTPFIHGVVDLSIRDKLFSSRYRSGVQTFLCKLLRDCEANVLRLIFVQTFSLWLWASITKTTVVSRKNWRNHLKICFHKVFWALHLGKFITNNCEQSMFMPEWFFLIFIFFTKLC